MLITRINYYTNTIIHIRCCVTGPVPVRGDFFLLCMLYVCDVRVTDDYSLPLMPLVTLVVAYAV
jgi:hypothetical protein